MFFKIIIYCLWVITGLQADVEQDGIVLQKMTPDMLEAAGLSIDHGVIVTDLDENSLITKELKQGDVITNINGTKVDSPNQLMQNFVNTISEKIPLTLWRNSRKKEIFLYPNADQENIDLLGGAEFTNTKGGVVVNQPGKTGLFEKGDLILRFNDKDVMQAEEISQEIAQHPSGFSVIVDRKGIQIAQTIATDKNGNSSFSQRFMFG